MSTMADSAMIPMLELSEKDLKAAILSMSDKIKQNMFLMDGHGRKLRREI